MIGHWVQMNGFWPMSDPYIDPWAEEVFSGHTLSHTRFFSIKTQLSGRATDTEGEVLKHLT